MAKLKNTQVYGTLTVDEATLISADTTIAGNLTVTGETFYTNITTVEVTDPLMGLGNGANNATLTTDDGKDRGLVLHRYDGVAIDSFMGWDRSASEFIVASNVTISDNIVTVNTYGNLHANMITANAAFLTSIPGGNVTGFVPNATDATTAGQVTGNAQGNITSVGTLSSLSVTGTANVGNLDTVGVIRVSNGTNSTTNSSGALVVDGGVGIGGNLHVGGTLFANISGTLSAPGSNTYVLFNDGGSANAVSTFAFDKTTSKVTTGNLSLTGNANVQSTLTFDNTNGSITGYNVEYGAGNQAKLARSTTESVTLDSSGIKLIVGSSQVQLDTFGALTIPGDLKGPNANIYANGDIQTDTTVSATGDIYSGQDITAVGNIHSDKLIDGNNITATHLVTTSNLSITGSITGHAVPSSNTTYDLGNTTNRWRSSFFNTSVVIDAQSLTGNSTHLATSGNLQVGNKLDVTGNIEAGNISATLLTGTLTTASQPNVTSVGTLSSLSVSGNVTTGGVVTDNLYHANGNAWQFDHASGNTGEVQFRDASGNLDATDAFKFTVATSALDLTGTMTAGNLNTGGQVSATGNIQGGNLFTGGFASVTGNVIAGNVTTGGIVSATGNISTADSVFAANVSASGNVIAGGNLVTTAIKAGSDLTIGVTGNIQYSVSGNVVNFNGAKLTGLADPENASDAATRGYVDSVAQGLHVHPPVDAATTANLATLSGGSVTYATQTITLGTALPATIDGYTWTADETRILVKDEAATQRNGIYTIDATGQILTRTADANAAADMGGGDFVFVVHGTLYGDTGWVQTELVATLGTSPIVWEQFSGAGTFTADGTKGMALDGTVFSTKIDTGTLAYNGSGNIKVADSAAFVTPNIGAATGSSLSILGNITGGNLSIGGVIIANGNISTSGVFNGNVNGNISGNFAGNITAPGANGAIQFVSQSDGTSGVLANSQYLSYYTGNVTMNVGRGNSGIITTDTITGNISTTSGTQANITSVGTLTDLSVTGNISSGANVRLTGSGGFYGDNYFYANGVAIDFQTAAGNAFEVQYKAASGNDLAAEEGFSYNPSTNTLSVGNAALSSLSSTQVVYATTDGKLVGHNNMTFNGTDLSVTGNVTMNVAFATTLHSSALSSTRIPFTNSSNILTDSSSLTFDTTASELRTANFSASGNIAASLVTAGTLSATGNVLAGNVSVTGDVHGTTLTGSISSSSGSQANITSVGTLTSLSINGVTSLGPIANVRISDGTNGQYIISNGAGGLSWDTLDLSIIDNGSSNVSIPASGGNINMSVGGTANVVVVTGTGANVTGIINASGNVIGNNLIANTKIFANAAVDSTSAITGTIIVNGGMAANGNIYTGKSIGFANNNGGTASKAYIQFNDTSNSLDFIFD
jgi:filamentous hemagglutinin